MLVADLALSFPERDHASLHAHSLELRTAELVAFGATRKAGTSVHQDAQVQALVDSLAPVVTLVAKSDLRHVERALRTTPAENLLMITDTVAYLREQGRLVDFINLGTFYPCRLEFNDYLRWVASHFEAQAAYGQTVVAVEPVPGAQGVDVLRVRAHDAQGREREHLTRALVLSTGGTPRRPPGRPPTERSRRGGSAGSAGSTSQPSR